MSAQKDGTLHVIISPILSIVVFNLSFFSVFSSLFSSLKGSFCTVFNLHAPNELCICFYAPDLHLLARFLILLPLPSVSGIRFPTLSDSVVFWLYSRSSVPPSSFFPSLLAASIIPRGYLMIPQVRANGASDAYTGVAMPLILMCFFGGGLQAAEKPL